MKIFIVADSVEGRYLPFSKQADTGNKSAIACNEMYQRIIKAQLGNPYVAYYLQNPECIKHYLAHVPADSPSNDNADCVVGLIIPLKYGTKGQVKSLERKIADDSPILQPIFRACEFAEPCVADLRNPIMSIEKELWGVEMAFSCWLQEFDLHYQ